jgi:hypothetical protein
VRNAALGEACRRVPAKLNMESEMRGVRSIEIYELDLISGGDAAATRLPGTNSWGEPLPIVVSQICVTVKTGPITTSSCINSDGTKTTTRCTEIGIGGSAGPFAGGISGSVCESTTVPLRLTSLLKRQDEVGTDFGWWG